MTLKDIVAGTVIVGAALLAMTGETAEAGRSPYIGEVSGTTDMIVVKGLAHRFNTDYLGVTIDSNRDGRFDIDDINLSAVPIRGNFHESFFIAGYKLDHSLAGAGYLVSIWDGRVENCGCSWCDKYGYHLKGRMARKTGRIEKSSWDW